MEKVYLKFNLKGLTEDEKQDLKGVHLVHPILPDDTLCCVAISDNPHNADYTVSDSGRVTCASCLKIIEYCK